jgi:DinB superfamily
LNPALEKKFNLLQKNKENILQQIKGLDNKILFSKPRPRKWSAAQILYHVFQSEYGVQRYLKKKIQALHLPKTGFRERIRSWLLDKYLKSSRKFKAPKGIDVPQAEFDLNKFLEKWDLLREEMRSFLDNFPREKIDRSIFKHPVVGRIDIFQTLSFLDLHSQRHFQQIRTILDIAEKNAKG